MIQQEEGRYLVRVSEQIFGENENGKLALMFQVELLKFFDTAGGANEPAEVECHGDQRQIAFYFASDENVKISVKELRKLGWAGETFADFTGDKPAWSLVGKESYADCRHETYTDKRGEDRQTERWSFATPRSVADRLTAATKKKALELDARFGALLKGLPPAPSANQKTPPPAKPAAKAGKKKAAAAAGDEEIPF